MYVPAQFRQEDVGELKRLMRAHDFATLITTGPDGVPFATHLPLLLEQDAADDRTLFLRSHMALANPQWKHLTVGREVLAIFQGPHALVHSNWYRLRPERADLELRGGPRLRAADGGRKRRGSP